MIYSAHVLMLSCFRTFELLFKHLIVNSVIKPDVTREDDEAFLLNLNMQYIGQRYLIFWFKNCFPTSRRNMLFLLDVKIGGLQMQKVLYSDWVRELVGRDHSTDISCEFYCGYLALGHLIKVTS